MRPAIMLVFQLFFATHSALSNPPRVTTLLRDDAHRRSNIRVKNLGIRARTATTSSGSKVDYDPVKLASNVVSLLGSKEDAKTVDADLSRKLRGCMKFLVPPPPKNYHVDNNILYGSEVGFHRKLNGFKGEDKRINEGEDKRINELVWWPPMHVLELARQAVESKGDTSVLEHALNSSLLEVPNFENCFEDKCQLTRHTFGRQFMKNDLNLYMAFLFEAISALAPSIGLNISLSRYDLFHGHVFFATSTSRLGILFHAKEYPAYNKQSFPFNLGYCQKGSGLPYDYSINLRNILWLAPLPDLSSKNWSNRWLAPGALVVLDAHPGGIIYDELVSVWVQEFRTIYEDDFGDAVMDINYLNVVKSTPEDKIFVC